MARQKECCLCHKPAITPTKEHLTPKSRGGPNGSSNVRIACQACNLAKGDMTLPEYQHFRRTGKFRASYIRWLEQQRMMILARAAAADA
jgi:5-methylcytosine-specific restriction endonuclease McrA